MRRLRELRREKVTLTAFSDDDMEAIAKKLGLYEDIKDGKAKCVICGCVVTFKNLGAFLKLGSEIKTVCDDSKCLYKAIMIARELKH